MHLLSGLSVQPFLFSKPFQFTINRSSPEGQIVESVWFFLNQISTCFEYAAAHPCRPQAGVLTTAHLYHIQLVAAFTRLILAPQLNASGLLLAVFLGIGSQITFTVLRERHSCLFLITLPVLSCKHSGELSSSRVHVI